MALQGIAILSNNPYSLISSVSFLDEMPKMGLAFWLFKYSSCARTYSGANVLGGGFAKDQGEGERNNSVPKERARANIPNPVVKTAATPPATFQP